MNPLFRLWFGPLPHIPVNSFATQHKTQDFAAKISLANFSFPTSLSREGGMRPV
jgi:hypothetical protein